MSPRPRLLFVIHSLEGGGAERVAVTLANELASQGFPVTLFLFRELGEYWQAVSPRVRVVSALPAHRSPHRGVGRILWRLFREAVGHDLIIGALEGWPTIFTCLAAMACRRRCLGWVHTMLSTHSQACWSALQTLLARWSYGRLDRVICVSQGTMANFRQFAGGGSGRCSVIHNPIGIPAGHALRQDRQREAGRILAVGRLVLEQKGFDLLIRAFARLFRLGIATELVILGEGPDRPQLEALAAAEGVAAAVRLPGFFADIWPWYDWADVLALSSRYEGFSNVILEALARGCPVVAADCPSGPREILADGRYGELVAAGDEAALAHGLQRLLSDGARRRQLSELGPARAREFSPTAIVPQWQAAIEQLLPS